MQNPPLAILKDEGRGIDFSPSPGALGDAVVFVKAVGPIHHGRELSPANPTQTRQMLQIEDYRQILVEKSVGVNGKLGSPRKIQTPLGGLRMKECVPICSTLQFFLPRGNDVRCPGHYLLIEIIPAVHLRVGHV